MKKHEAAKVLKTYEKGFVGDEILYTDSGYASCTDLGRISHALSKPGEHVSTIRRDADEEDAQTTYSVATSMDPANAQNYISDLSHHIHGNLQEHVDSGGRSELCRSLPELIKAFAIKIGCENASQLNRDIMYFIHKRHK